MKLVERSSAPRLKSHDSLLPIGPHAEGLGFAWRASSAPYLKRNGPVRLFLPIGPKTEGLELTGRANQSGFSILLVFGMVTLITLCFSGVFYSTSRLVDVVHKRELYARKRYATEGLLNYGIAFVRTHYPILREHAQSTSQKITAHFDEWPIGDGRVYTGITTIGLHGDIALLAAALYYDGRECYKLSCAMCPASLDGMSYKIYDWCIH